MASALPTGTVTFLFTDIEGSTRMLQRLGEAYARVLGESQRLLRQAFAEYGGVEVDTQGDSFFVAFPTAVDAVAAAAAATRSLAAHPWPEGGAVRVRMGLHTGTPQLAGDRYVGLDVHRAARIAAAGHGGQILLSESTRALAFQNLPDGATLLDLGTHRLKDLQYPELLAQLVLTGLPSEFPPLKTLDRRPDHLPAPSTPFVGRSKELTYLQRLLDAPDYRLLTLTGPGGIGKTRLAVEVAQRSSTGFADGAHFVPLAAVQSPDLLLFALGDVLDFSFAGQEAPVAQFVTYLRDKNLLLLLDNFEHLVDAAPILADLLAGAPHLKVLITSRERLNLHGEWVLPIEGIDYPTTIANDHIESYPAVQLFARSAQRVQPDFSLQVHAPDVLRVCQLVEGMPLAIELAAAWVRLLPCSQIVAKLASSPDFLASPLRDLPERHRSLRAVFDHSWSLLSPAEQMALARLSVFRGPFDLAAAEEVCEASLPVLASLADKSLLQADGKGGYALHELLRHYAAERLAQQPAEASLGERAIDYLTRAAERASQASAQRQAAAYLGQAIAIAEAAGILARLGELHYKRGQALSQVGLWVEARPEVQAALAATDPDNVDQIVQILIALSDADFFQWNVASQGQHVRQALARAEAAGREAAGRQDLVRVAMVKLGFVETNDGRVEEAVSIFKRPWPRARTLTLSSADPSTGSVVTRMPCSICAQRSKWRRTIRSARSSRFRTSVSP